MSLLECCGGIRNAALVHGRHVCFEIMWLSCYVLNGLEPIAWTFPTGGRRVMVDSLKAERRLAYSLRKAIVDAED